MVGLDLAGRLPIAGLAVCGRCQLAYLWGHEDQQFTEITGGVSGTSKSTDIPGVGIVEVQGGLRWTAPAGCPSEQSLLRV